MKYNEFWCANRSKILALQRIAIRVTVNWDIALQTNNNADKILQ